eukprot:COSAG01_NODE_2642_length_7323_cov_13.197121_4_plen_480_part_00
MNYPKNSTYQNLPDCLYQLVSPRIPTQPEVLCYNQTLAEELGLAKTLHNKDLQQSYLSGAKLFQGCHPLALAYAGHQFGHFVPQLGDGRAHIIAECHDQQGQCFDLQLKGSGQTRFSRRGDGLAPLTAALREYLISEAMAQLGVPTTRALAVVATGDPVHREQRLPGAVITRIASSHLRIGSFEYAACRQDMASLKALADFAITRHDAELHKQQLSAQEKYISFFKRVGQRQVKLVAQWLSLGFIHGVMNTDNTSISGETIDFGPCAFMDHYQANQVYSSIDHHGRYAYHNQSKIVLWNLSCLAQCLWPLLGLAEDEAIKLFNQALAQLAQDFDAVYLQLFSKKLGIKQANETDLSLIQAFLAHLEAEKLDFTNAFRNLATQLSHDHSPEIYQQIKARLWEQDGQLSDAIKQIKAVNPVIIPRNHQVEKALQDALAGDLAHFTFLLQASNRPYDDIEQYASLKQPPKKDQVVQATFCGT